MEMFDRIFTMIQNHVGLFIVAVIVFLAMLSLIIVFAVKNSKNKKNSAFYEKLYNTTVENYKVEREDLQSKITDLTNNMVILENDNLTYQEATKVARETAETLKQKNIELATQLKDPFDPKKYIRKFNKSTKLREFTNKELESFSKDDLLIICDNNKVKEVSSKLSKEAILEIIYSKRK